LRGERAELERHLPHLSGIQRRRRREVSSEAREGWEHRRGELVPGAAANDVFGPALEDTDGTHPVLVSRPVSVLEHPSHRGLVGAANRRRYD
jgi:hypothetical protein